MRMPRLLLPKNLEVGGGVNVAFAVGPSVCICTCRSLSFSPSVSPSLCLTPLISDYFTDSMQN